MRKVLLIVMLAAALAALAGCAGDEEAGSGEEGGGTAAVHGASREGEAAVDEAASGEAVPAASSLPSVGPRVIQTASLQVLVPRNGFDDAVQRARTIAAGYGGFVVSSTASQGEERRLVHGSLVLRVPARSYAQALRRLEGLGRVESREESGQDVSQEFVDLRSRIRHLEAVERQLLELLGDADSVPAALAVQERLNQVQLELEQARGRLQYLDDQVAYATISLELRERAVPPPGGGGWGIVEAWERAGRAFLAVVGFIFVAVASAAPVLVLLALALLVARAALRRRGSFSRA